MRSFALPSCALALLAGLGLARGSGEDPSAALWAAAKVAQARGDAAAVTRLARAWATSQPDGAAPEGLEAAAEEARAFAATQGRLRVYASRVSPTRLRVGLDDPAAVVDHVDVFGESAEGARARLTREESESAGRQEYRVPPGVRLAVVEAVMLVGSEPVVLASVSTSMAEAAPLPAAPAPKAPPVVAQEEAAPEASPVPWWWVAVGVVAAGLAGAAIWQETR